jgi:hypothetical protein
MEELQLQGEYVAIVTSVNHGLTRALNLGSMALLLAYQPITCTPKSNTLQ